MQLLVKSVLNSRPENGVCSPGDGYNVVHDRVVLLSSRIVANTHSAMAVPKHLIIVTSNPLSAMGNFRHHIIMNFTYLGVKQLI
jgi:uncharacterized protein YdaL